MMGSFKPVLLSLVILISVFGFNTLNADDHKTISISTFPIETRFSKCAKNMVSELYKAIGYDVAFRHLPGERSLVEVNFGNVHAELMRIDGIHKRYENLVKVPTPLFQLSAMAYTTDPKIVINSWKDLKPYRVAYELGFKLADNNIQSKYSFKTSNGWQSYVMLAKDKVDVVVDTIEEAEEHLLHSKVTKKIHSNGSVLARVNVYHYLHKSQNALVQPLNRLLLSRSIKKDMYGPCI